MWRVELIGLNSDGKYEYWVDLPSDARRQDVTAFAYRQHDQAWQAGTVCEGLAGTGRVEWRG
jgi:hypothetical protein